MGKYFVHSTGHGVGLDIHELPNISAKSDTVIENGMVFTVEPGIYIQDFFGVRIEDMVVMKNGKAETTLVAKVSKSFIKNSNLTIIKLRL